MNRYLKLVLAVTVPALITACAAPQAKYEPMANPTVQFTDIDQSRNFYDFDKVKINIVPYRTESVEMRYEVDVTQTGDIILGLVPTQVNINPALELRADAVFEVTVTNQMERILRLSDTIQDVRVNNQRSQTNTPVFAEAAFNSYTVLPGRTETLYIGIPGINRFGGSGQIEIAIFDIPVDIDEAGRITKRENLDAVFRYTINEGQVSVIRDNRSLMLSPRTFLKYRENKTFLEPEILNDLFPQPASSTAAEKEVEESTGS